MTEVRTVNVALGQRSYPIHIGAGLLDQGSLLHPHIHGRQVFIVTNSTVAPLYLEQLKSSLSGFQVASVVLPDGEEYKTLEQVSAIYDALLEARFERSCTLIALGGGVIGDMCGFAAATYLRGVNFIQVPTTLLSQVDSSVGGKTGVNRPLGKNMVGAFYQPRCVLADTSTLETLPERELKAGLAEVIKYGLINNPGFYQWLKDNMAGLRSLDQALITRAIEISCCEKAAIVAADEREGGVRATLNLGHTFGHAIETAMGYGKWLHGEAVATGMVMAADLSMRLGYISAAEAAGCRDLIAAAGLPVEPPAQISPGHYLELMARDKKAESGQIRFVLLEAIGRACIRSDIDRGLLEQTLTAGPSLASAT